MWPYIFICLILLRLRLLVITRTENWTDLTNFFRIKYRHLIPIPKFSESKYPFRIRNASENSEYQNFFFRKSVFLNFFSEFSDFLSYINSFTQTWFMPVTSNSKLQFSSNASKEFIKYWEINQTPDLKNPFNHKNKTPENIRVWAVNEHNRLLIGDDVVCKSNIPRKTVAVMERWWCTVGREAVLGLLTFLFTWLNLN